MKTRLWGFVGVLVVGGLLAGSLMSPKATAGTPTSAVQAVAERMANAIDHYDSLSATYAITDSRSGQTTSTDATFEVRMRPSPGARAELKTASGDRVTMVSDGKQELVHNHSERVYQISNIKAPGRTPAEQSFADRLAQLQEQKIVRYRRAPASLPTQYADALFPQQEALALIGRSEATVEGTEQFLGRTATVLKITPPDFLQQSLQAEQIRFWVDDETGVLLKQEYLKGKGTTFSQVATRFSVNGLTDADKFVVQVPEDATKVSSSSRDQ